MRISSKNKSRAESSPKKTQERAKKVLITGHKGYIGSRLVEVLEEEGYEVVGADLNAENSMDIRYIQNIDADAVVHLAAISHEPTAQYDPKKTDEINHKATERLARLVKEQGVKKFIYASTCSIYFTFDSPLNPEPSKETDEVNPISAYSLSKRSAEQSILNLHWHQFEPTIFRFGTVYGKSPNMRTDTVVHHMIKSLKEKGRISVHSGGKIWRPLADIEDVCWGIAKTLETNGIGGEIFNLATGNWDIKDLAKEIVRLNPDGKIETQPAGLTRNYLADTSKIKKILGYKTQRTFKSCIKELYETL